MSWAPFRRALFWAHLGLGVLAAAFILVLAGTGMVLAFEETVLHCAERKLLTVPLQAPPAQRLSLDALAAKAAQAPGAKEVSAFALSRAPGAAVRFQVGRDHTVWVDPYSGQVLGRGADALRAFFHKAEDLHRYFLFEGKARERAKQVKNAANAAFLLLILGGICLAWPRRWAWPDLRLRGKARDHQWHHSLGLLFWPAIVIISLSGGVLSYAWATDLLYKITGNEPPPRPVAAAVAKADAFKAGPDHWQRLLRAAEVQAPDWKSIASRAPRPGQDSVMLTIVTELVPPPRGRAVLSLDLKDGTVKKWEPYAGQNAGRKLRLWARWTHTGQSLGLPGQILGFLACAVILLLAYTGSALAWRRFFR